MARSQASAPNSPREKHADRLYEKPEKQADGSKRSHHVRRKSGPREEKKRPSLSRRTTPQYVKSSTRRDRDRERGDDAGRDRDRDGGESFPQFWYVLFSFSCAFFCFFLPFYSRSAKFIFAFFYLPWWCLGLFSCFSGENPHDLPSPYKRSIRLYK